MSEANTVQDAQPREAEARESRPVVPKDAAVVVLVREGEGGPEVFWARRGERMAFQPGVYA